MNNLKDILGKILKKTPNYEENVLKARIFEAWPRIVGEKVAAHCWPSKIVEGNALLIAGESSAWLHSLRYLEAQILTKYEKELGGKHVTGLRYKMENRPDTPVGKR
ncbi:MAG: DUF721 domain-containing protein [Deltaproteobacteria bacterium]|nr:DUF721 domain-containing protein [Deltaproteobacteria bacterium]